MPCLFLAIARAVVRVSNDCVVQRKGMANLKNVPMGKFWTLFGLVDIEPPNNFTSYFTGFFINQLLCCNLFEESRSELFPINHNGAKAHWERYDLNRFRLMHRKHLPYVVLDLLWASLLQIYNMMIWHVSVGDRCL